MRVRAPAGLLEAGFAALAHLRVYYERSGQGRPADLARIRAPTLVMAGDRDAIRLDHTIEIYRAIPTASLYIVAMTGHATFRDRPDGVDPVIRAFVDGAPPQ